MQDTQYARGIIIQMIIIINNMVSVYCHFCADSRSPTNFHFRTAFFFETGLIAIVCQMMVQTHSMACKENAILHCKCFLTTTLRRKSLTQHRLNNIFRNRNVVPFLMVI